VAFAGRRIRRLLPAALTVVIAVVIHEVVRDDPGRVEEVRRHAIGTLAYVANWVFIADGASYFADVAGPSMLRHVWSLAIEEQFYFVWPAVVLVASRVRGRHAVGAAAVIAGLVSIALMAVRFDGDDPSRSYFGTDTRIFEPLIGAAGAVVWPLRSAVPVWVLRIGTMAAGVWLAAVFVVDDAWAGFYRGGAAVLGLIGLLVVMAGTGSGVLSRVLGLRALAGLGVISYGVYLWHWPVLLMLRRAGWEGVGLDVAVVVLTLAVSAVSYRLLELPIRRGGRSSTTAGQRLRPIGISIAVAAVAVVAVIVVTRDPAPVDAVTSSDVIADLQDNGQSADPSGNGAVTVVLIGDSSAWTFGGGEVTSGDDHGPYVSPFDPEQITLVNLARKGYRLVTQPADEITRRPEDLEHETWWIETVRTLEPDLVVAMFGLNTLAGATPGPTDGPRDLADTPAGSLLDTLAGSAPVVLVGPPRLVPADMPDPDTAALFAAASESLIEQLNLALEQVADRDPRISFVDFGSWLCPGDDDPALRDGCRTTADQDPVRYDGIHYSTDGAAIAADWLTEPIVLAAASSP
jgi:peptidoglycan/LPS O-acetylase OafA/YrhL